MVTPTGALFNPKNRQFMVDAGLRDLKADRIGTEAAASLSKRPAHCRRRDGSADHRNPLRDPGPAVAHKHCGLHLDRPGRLGLTGMKARRKGQYHGDCGDRQRRQSHPVRTWQAPRRVSSVVARAHRGLGERLGDGMPGRLAFEIAVKG